MLKFLFFLLFYSAFSTKIVLEEAHLPHSHIITNDSLNFQLSNINREELDLFIDSESGLFRVHFDTTGENAVDLTDIDNNEIPDYIDSLIIYLDYSYDVEVNQLKWKAPTSDKYSEDGNGGSDAIDVYVKEIASYGYYGVADSEKAIIKGTTTGYLVLDNNYTDDIYNTLSYEALKVTVAHELHHLVQFAYTESLPHPIILEMLSTYIEELVYPGVMDMRFYVDSLFRSPLSSQLSDGNINFGYMYNIYFHYIHLKYGNEVVHNLWQTSVDNATSGEHFLKFWNDYFEENHNLTIGETFKEFTEWCYFSGERAIEGEYFPFADRFTTLRASTKTKYSNLPFSESKNVLQLGFNLINVEYLSESPGQTNDTIDVLITNINSDFSNNKDLDTYFFATSHKKLDNSFLLNNIDYYVVTSETDKFYYNIFELPGSKPEIVLSPYPSPYNLTQHRDIIFPVSEKHRVYDKIELQILNSNMENIYQNEIEIEILDNKKVIKFVNNSIINNSGIYYYTIKNDDDRKFGKFAVIK